MKNPVEILNEYWGYQSFKPSQEEVIKSVLNGQDTVALLPTGGGKSLCFQVPALASDGICIVISPLIALMNDQVSSLKSKGIKAMAITGGVSFNELLVLLDNASYGNYKFLYLSPERLQQEVVQNYIQKMTVNLIAVDEAHCISQWGNDFRPAYKNIISLRGLHPLVPIIALTATANKRVLEDTIDKLKLTLPKLIRSSFVRKNLSYQTLKENDKLYRIKRLLKDNVDNSIIYVRSRNAAIETSKHLNEMKLNTTYYHGGISKEEKETRLTNWKNGNVPIMICTNAFGMGIDQPNVRWVIHTQLPESIESYFQEAGRAGRDGRPATAIILYNDYDKELVRKQFITSLPSSAEVKILYKHLNNYFQIPYGEGEFTSHNFDFSEFCERYKLNSLPTFNGLNCLDRLGIIQLSKQFGRTTKVQFLVSSNQAIEYFDNNAVASVIGKTILRLYSGIFEAAASIDINLISKKSGQNQSIILDILKKMEVAEIISLKLNTTDATISFLVPREDEKTINVVAKQIDLQNNKKRSQVESVLDYVENHEKCRSQQLVEYFDENSSLPCGICSVCLKKNSSVSTKELKVISEQIMHLLAKENLDSRQLAERSKYEESDIIFCLRQLLDIGKIGINLKNEYYIDN